MPDKSMTVATYAAGASLAAITLIYVFGPTYFIDSEANSNRKKTVVGLLNPANDCFINSVLQALSGLGDLRSYLIRETHRRTLDEPWVYQQAVLSPDTRGMPEWKVHGLQDGIVTKALKSMLDGLNERPIYRKTVTAGPFIRELERAFHQRISRQQQDAQEFLQIVAERLSEEYHAGHRARIAARKSSNTEAIKLGDPIPRSVPEEAAKQLGDEPTAAATPAEGSSPSRSASSIPTIHTPVAENDKEYEEEEGGFPMEGAYHSQIECMTCRFKPKPKESTFCTLTLNVPHGVSSTSLNTCFDGLFKTEQIDDWKCEKCRLMHAVGHFQRRASRQSCPRSERAELENQIKLLQQTIEVDPEKPPEGVKLPESKDAPSRKIGRHTYMTRFPKILAVHLSRSIYGGNMSMKNSAKVSFPETLKLGTLRFGMENYKLLAVVTHKGNHHSGHYETFRRQNVYPPFSNPATFQPSGVYSKTASPASTPQLKAATKGEGDASPLASTPDLLAPALGRPANGSPESLGRKSSENGREPSTNGGRSRVAQLKDAETSSIKSVAASAKSSLSKMSLKSANGGVSSTTENASANGSFASRLPMRKKKRASDKWWRISDEKVKETRTSSVLDMQKEVYLLFYELDRGQ